MEQIRTFSGFSQFFVQCTKISFRRGGVCVYFLKSVRKGRFRNVWVKGGYVTIFLSTEAELFGISGFSGLRLLRTRVRDTNSWVFPWVLQHIVELEESERR